MTAAARLAETPERTLLDAVDDLSLPRRTANWVDGALVHRTDPPLLEDLRDAIGSNIGGSGGGKQARERTPIDLAAFQVYERIDGTIRAWLADLGARPGKDVLPERALRSWYVLWSARAANAVLEPRFRVILDGWADEIRDKLDPPNRIEITAPCPVCGQEWKNIGLKLDTGEDDPDDVERVRVLNAVERESLSDSYAMCSACGTVWFGVSRMRELRIAIDDAEKAREPACPSKGAAQ